MDEILFRGWSEELMKWRYGHLVESGNKIFVLASFTPYSPGLAGGEVHPDSIGIYINKKDKDGKKIFCGCNGAKYGSDIVKQRIEAIGLHTNDWKTVEGEVVYSDLEQHFSICGFYPFDEDFETEVISNQWEEHLKEQ